MAPPKRAPKKRSRSKSSPRDKQKPPEVSEEYLGKVEETLERLLVGDGSDRCNDATLIQAKLESELTVDFADASEIQQCLQLESLDDIKSELTRLVVARFSQQQKVERVFQMLDEAGKGVVVLGDLKRVAVEMLGEEITEDDLIEMIQEVDVSGDGILTQADLDRVARLCRL